MAKKKLCVCDSDRKQFSEMTNDMCCNECGGIVITTESLIYHMLQCGDIGLSDFFEWKKKDDEVKTIATQMMNEVKRDFLSLRWNGDSFEKDDYWDWKSVPSYRIVSLYK